MARYVEEIMNRELFHLRPDDPAATVIGHLIAVSVTAAPVLDDERRPVGMVSWRDVAQAPATARAADRMTRPVATARLGATIDEVARRLDESGYHRLVVVDGRGRAVGIVSALDVVRGLVGVPARHPDVFPHFDRETGVAWTPDFLLTLNQVESAPDGPGVIVLRHGEVGLPDVVVWAEATSALRSRLLDIVSLPQREQPALQRWIDRGNLRFRAALVAEGSQREAIAAGIMERVRHAPRPPGIEGRP